VTCSKPMVDGRTIGALSGLPLRWSCTSIRRRNRCLMTPNSGSWCSGIQRSELRIYTNDDVIGVNWGALKNIVAIGRHLRRLVWDTIP